MLDRSRALRRAVACALTFLATAFAAVCCAEDPVAAPSDAWIGENVDVRVVNLAVRVTDRAGRPVEDLTREDFALEEDGKPVAITHFAPPANGAPTDATAAAAPVATTARDLGTTILLFDDLHLAGASRARAIAGLRERIAAGDLGERLIVVTYDRGGLEVRVPLGATRDETVQALAELPAPTGAKAAGELRSMLQTLRDMQRGAFEGGRQHWKEDPPCSTTIAQGVANYADWARGEARDTLAAAAQLLDSLAAVPGGKRLLLITDGVPLQPGLEGFEALRVLCDGTGARQGLQYSVDVAMEEDLRDNPRVYRPNQGSLASAALNLASDLERLATRANAAGVAMVTLQASGLAAGNAEAADGTSRSVTQEERTGAAENLRDPLTALASATGGDAILDTNDLAGAIARSTAGFRAAYSLAFSPVRLGDDRVHSLKLSIRRAGLTLRYRQSYRDDSPSTAIAQQLSGALLHGLWRDPWGVGLELQELPGAAVINLTLPMAHLAALPDGGGAGHASLTIFMALRGADGAVTPVRQVRVPVVLPKERSAASIFPYGIRVRRPAGEHVVALLVRDDLSAETVLLRRAFRIPPS